MHKVFINVARGHVERAPLSLSSPLLFPLSSAFASRESSSVFSLARSMRQTTVNQWASSAGSHPRIFPDGQRQQQQQHARPPGERVQGEGKERERERAKQREERGGVSRIKWSEEGGPGDEMKIERVGESAAGA